MKLQTHIPILAETRNPIDYSSRLLLLGSCFSENIGNTLDYYKFQSKQNPFGILFHPIAIEKLIRNALNKREFTEKEIFEFQDRWHSFETHSKLSDPNKDQLLEKLNGLVIETHKSIESCSHMVITLGTAWVYRHIETDQIVANCHKIAQKKFLKELLSVEEITQSLESIIALARMANPQVNFIFTVSPIRHLKDGFTPNQQSKSHLIAAIHQVIDPRKKLFYFPSYEIMMDELRDYRFYAKDMIHPNETAIDYIWNKFAESWISKDSKPIMKKVDSIQKRILHRPFHPNSQEHQRFLAQLETDKQDLQKELPYLRF